MRRNHSLAALGLMLFAVLACRTFQRISARESLFEGSHLQEAAAAFKSKAGGSIKAVTLEITADTATLRAQDPTQPEHVDEYVYSKGYCGGPSPVRLEQLGFFEQHLNLSVFNLDEVDFTATDAVVKSALARLKVEGGKVTKITIHRNLAIGPGDSGDKFITVWTVEVDGTRESASATANAKGEIIGVDLSRTTRGEKQTYLSPQAMADAVQQIKNQFGGQVYLTDLTVSSTLLFGAGTSSASDEVALYEFDLNGVQRRVLGIGPTPPYGYKVHEIYFTFDDIDFSKTHDVLTAAFEKCGITQPYISNMSFARTTEGYPDHKVKGIEWRVLLGQTGNLNTSVAVYFDAKGNFLRTYKS